MNGGTLMPKVTIAIDTKNLIVVTGDHGGYLTGRCIACHEGGWIFDEKPRDAPYGWPYGANGKHVMQNGIIHEKDCPVGALLTENGKLKKKRARP